jgi:hypothetical protein
LIIGETLGWQVKANPLIEATVRISLNPRGLKSKKDELILSKLPKRELIRVRVEMMRAAMATGLSMKTYFRSFR